MDPSSSSASKSGWFDKFKEGFTGFKDNFTSGFTDTVKVGADKVKGLVPSSETLTGLAIGAGAIVVASTPGRKKAAEFAVKQLYPLLPKQQLKERFSHLRTIQELRSPMFSSKEASYEQWLDGMERWEESSRRSEIQERALHLQKSKGIPVRKNGIPEETFVDQAEQETAEKFGKKSTAALLLAVTLASAGWSYSQDKDNVKKSSWNSLLKEYAEGYGKSIDGSLAMGKEKTNQEMASVYATIRKMSPEEQIPYALALRDTMKIIYKTQVGMAKELEKILEVVPPEFDSPVVSTGKSIASHVATAVVGLAMGLATGRVNFAKHTLDRLAKLGFSQSYVQNIVSGALTIAAVESTKALTTQTVTEQEALAQTRAFLREMGYDSSKSSYSEKDLAVARPLANVLTGLVTKLMLNQEGLKGELIEFFIENALQHVGSETETFQKPLSGDKLTETFQKGVASAEKDKAKIVHKISVMTDEQVGEIRKIGKRAEVALKESQEPTELTKTASSVGEVGGSALKASTLSSK